MEETKQPMGSHIIAICITIFAGLVFQPFVANYIALSQGAGKVATAPVVQTSTPQSVAQQQIVDPATPIIGNVTNSVLGPVLPKNGTSNVAPSTSNRTPEITNSLRQFTDDQLWDVISMGGTEILDRQVSLNRATVRSTWIASLVFDMFMLDIEKRRLTPSAQTMEGIFPLLDHIVLGVEAGYGSAKEAQHRVDRVALQLSSNDPKVWDLIRGYRQRLAKFG